MLLTHYDDFRYRHKSLVAWLSSQGYVALQLDKSFKKIYGRYQEVIEKYQRSFINGEWFILMIIFILLVARF